MQINSSTITIMDGWHIAKNCGYTFLAMGFATAIALAYLSFNDVHNQKIYIAAALSGSLLTLGSFITIISLRILKKRDEYSSL